MYKYAEFEQIVYCGSRVMSIFSKRSRPAEMMLKFCILIHFNIVYINTGMQNGVEASPSISQAGHGQLLK